MSWTKHDLSCPRGHFQRVALPTRLEPDELDDARASLLEGRFGRFRCEFCAAPFEVESRLTFTDFVRGHLLSLQPLSALPGWSRLERRMPSVPSPDRPSPIQLRLVFGYAQLREKLLLWDAGLDDRLVEVLKLMVLFRPELGLAGAERYHLGLEHIGADRLVFAAERLHPPHRPERISISLECYHEARALIDQYRSSYPDLFRAPFASALRYLLPAQ